MSLIAFIHTPHIIKKIGGKPTVQFYCAIADVGDAVHVHHHRILREYLQSGDYAPIIDKAGLLASRTAADWRARCTQRGLPLLLPGTRLLVTTPIDDPDRDGQYDLRLEERRP